MSDYECQRDDECTRGGQGGVVSWHCEDCFYQCKRDGYAEQGLNSDGEDPRICTECGYKNQDYECERCSGSWHCEDCFYKCIRDGFAEQAFSFATKEMKEDQRKCSKCGGSSSEHFHNQEWRQLAEFTGCKEFTPEKFKYSKFSTPRSYESEGVFFWKRLLLSTGLPCCHAGNTEQCVHGTWPSKYQSYNCEPLPSWCLRPAGH